MSMFTADDDGDDDWMSPAGVVFGFIIAGFLVMLLSPGSCSCQVSIKSKPVEPVEKVEGQ